MTANSSRLRTLFSWRVPLPPSPLRWDWLLVYWGTNPPRVRLQISRRAINHAGSSSYRRIVACRQGWIPSSGHFVPRALQELAVQHVERETVVRLGILPLCALSTERQFLAQVTNPQVFVIALQELVVEVAKRERVGG